MTPAPRRRCRERRGPVAIARDLLTRSPARAAALIFLAAGIAFTALLSLPISTASGVSSSPEDVAFAAFSAVTVTGLTTVDTATHWSLFGQIVILVAIQVGGLGIVTLALLLARVVTRQLGVRGKVFAQHGVPYADRVPPAGPPWTLHAKLTFQSAPSCSWPGPWPRSGTIRPRSLGSRSANSCSTRGSPQR